MTEKRKLVARIVVVSLIVIIAAGLIVGDVYASRYAPIISSFLGCAEQLEGDTTKINEAAKTSDELVRKLADEGVVLLKNERDADGKPCLPLSKNKKEINIFGWGATDYGFLLTGNGSGKSLVSDELKVTLLKACTDSGITYNREIIGLYEKHRKDQDKDWGEYATTENRSRTTLKEPVTSSVFTDAVIARAKEFSDTAVVVLSRYSGEFLHELGAQEKYGLPTDTSRNFGEISTEEETLLKMCCENFDKVIVVFNSGSMMDMTFLDDGSVGKIDAALNVGYVGQSGATAIPKILYGDVNPSGKLADTVVYEPKKNEICRYNSREWANENSTAGTRQWRKDAIYDEDVYLGYKFHETADVEGFYDDREFIGKKGYDAVVQYPFGHGLSYTAFDWSLESVSLAEGSVLEKDSEIEIEVKVTNSGSVAGKDVVQLYFTPPYIKNQIEKPSISLLDFAKTPILKPTESATVTLKTTAYDMASYDCYDKNYNGNKGWELDAGTYVLKLMSDAHNAKTVAGGGTLSYEVKGAAIYFDTDPASGNEVKNRYTGGDAYNGLPLDGSTLGAKWTYLTRADFAGTVPSAKYPALDGNSAAMQKVNAANKQYGGYESKYTTMPTMGKEGNLRLITKTDGSFVTSGEFTDGKTELKYNDELVFFLGNPENWESDKWDTLLDQLSAEDLRSLVEDAGYGTRAAVSIGKNIWLDYDGPSGFNTANLNAGSTVKLTALPTENLVGQTYNKELLFQAGQVIGMDAENFGLSGIYAPGVNLHKHSLNGRNYEYYSEDAVLSGKLAANFCLGAKSNGVCVYVKHMALFDPSMFQRVWATEQNFRENYLKPFEIAVKEGGATGIMTSFNNIGAVWAGADYAMCTSILRDEWGFKGNVITDYSDGVEHPNMKIRWALRAGGNTQLNPNYKKAGEAGRIDLSNAVDMNLARLSAKELIYAKCNVYTAAKNNTIKNEFTVEVSGPRSIKYKFPWWIPVVVVINVIVFGLLVWRSLALALPLAKELAVSRGKPPKTADGGARPTKSRRRTLEREEPVLQEQTSPPVKEQTAKADKQLETVSHPQSAEKAEPPAPPEKQPNALSRAEAEEIKEEIAGLKTDMAEIKEMLSAIVPAQTAKKKPTTKQEITEMRTQIDEIKALIGEIAKK